MANLNQIEKSYSKTNNGSINYEYYDNKARNIRSESIWTLLKSIFNDKRSSSTDNSEACVVISLKMNQTQSKFTNIVKVAA